MDESGTISVTETATGTFKYAVVASDPTTAIAAWTVATTENDINTELSVTLAASVALTFTDNDKYLVAVDIDGDGNAVSAGSCLISGIESPYTFNDTDVPEATEGGAGYSQTIKFADGVTFTGSEYVVVQVTAGEGVDAQNTLIMIKLLTGTTEVTFSYEGDASAVKVWLASGMPNLNSAEGTGVISYDTYEFE